MINNDLRKVLKGHVSRYSLVTATAKRARIIAEEAEENGIIITEKPVSLAIEEILDGKFTIIEPEEIRNI
ncbi:MAG TPA: DNA-directed RNA polymerase subunit omega [Clostridia bacterium]|nr:DNA-directed RNA polymerase subunit omega [Clostridia bacterium]